MLYIVSPSSETQILNVDNEFDALILARSVARKSGFEYCNLVNSESGDVRIVEYCSPMYINRKCCFEEVDIR